MNKKVLVGGRAIQQDGKPLAHQWEERQARAGFKVHPQYAGLVQIGNGVGTLSDHMSAGRQSTCPSRWNGPKICKHAPAKSEGAWVPNEAVWSNDWPCWSWEKLQYWLLCFWYNTDPLNRVLFTADKNARKLQTVYEHLYTHMRAPQICLCKTGLAVCSWRAMRSRCLLTAPTVIFRAVPKV